MKDIYFVMPIDNSRLVPVADPHAARKCLSIALLASFCFGTVLFSAWQSFECVQYGYRIERLQREKQQTLEANRKLRLEVASLGDPVRIDTIARNQLGMTSLSPAQIVSGEASSLAPEVSVLAKVRRLAAPLPPQAKNVAVVVP